MDRETKKRRLGILYKEAEELEKNNSHAEAAIKYHEVVGLAEHLLGSKHPQIFLFRDNWAHSLHQSGSYSQAASCNEATLRGRRELDPVEPLQLILENQRRLARNYVRMGQNRKAMTQYREICEAMTDDFKGRPNWKAESGLAKKMYHDANGLAVALVTYLKSHEERSNADINQSVQVCKQILVCSSFSPDDDLHNFLLNLCYNLGCALEECGRSGEAKGLFEQIVSPLRHNEGQIQPQEPRHFGEIFEKAAERLKRLEPETPNITVSNETPVEQDDAHTTRARPVTRVSSRKGRTLEGSLAIENVHVRPNSVPPARRTEAPALDLGEVGQGRTLTTPTEHQRHTLRRRRKSDLNTQEKKGGLFGGDSDMNQAEKFFTRLESTVHTFLDHYEGPEADPIKIAVLDTGVCLKRKTRKAEEEIGEAEKKMNEAKDKMKGLYDHIKSPKPKMEPSASRTHQPEPRYGPPGELLNNPQIDADGHGTECFYLLARVCPYAKITPYRVMEHSEATLEVNRVNAALEHAIKVQKVDIISMSFGLDEDNDKTIELIKLAHEKSVLLFAATSNSGKEMKFPARSANVIAVDAAKDDATPFTGNPAIYPDKPERFTALGVDIESVITSKLQSGTSFAAPVAAGTAGLLLHFAKQNPLCLEKRILHRLKTQDGIIQVFRKELCLEKAGFHYIDITKLKSWCEGVTTEQREWFDHRSNRYKAAMQIANVFGANQTELTKTIENECDRLRQKAIHP